MAAPGGENQGFEKLKALLLGDAVDRLDAIETQARRVDAYVGDKSRLEAATADILVEAFRKAEVARHKLGDFSWSGPSQQKIDNLSDKPLELVVLELKTIY